MPIACCLVLCALPVQDARPAYYALPIAELTPRSGTLPPGLAEARWYPDWAHRPYAVLEGAGEAVFLAADELEGFPPATLEAGQLFVKTPAARELDFTLFLPPSAWSGEDSGAEATFTVPAARATGDPALFLRAQRAHYARLVGERLPGGAWFRHRHEELGRELGLGPDDLNPNPLWGAGEDELSETLSLFSGNRALAENLQLARVLPDAGAGEESVELASIPGLTLRAVDWKPLLAEKAPALDELAASIPADQHALFLPSFPALLATLDEAERLGDVALAAFEARASDAGTRRRLETQLGLELDAMTRALGPQLIEGVALTGSDPYLRSGSDVAVLLACKDAELVQTLVVGRWQAGAVDDGAGARHYRTPTRSHSSYARVVGKHLLVVANSPVQLERLAAVQAGTLPALTTADEYRYYRQRYPLGAPGESAFLVLPDAAIRRWCSPEWRIGASRRVRASAALAELHAAHAEELLGAPAARALGREARFPQLGDLSLDADGVHSSTFGSLDFLTPIAELGLRRVTVREKELYEAWRGSYEQNWARYFDPVGATLAVGPKKTALDLSVRPLILATDYDELREVANGAPLAAASGDPHPEALAQVTLSLNPDWEPLKSAATSLGSMAPGLGADPLSWLGGWACLYLDEGEVWDELLETEDLDEALENLRVDLTEVPLVAEVGVSSPVKLALFLTGLRAFVDGTAPGMTEWKERVTGERRFVEIRSPGFDDFRLFYATVPEAWILSLNEAALLAAVERYESRRASSSPPSAPWAGAHAALEIRGRGLELLETVLSEGIGSELAAASFRNLPILDEWRRRWPERDPVAVHERLFRERLTCPAGGRYVWDEDAHGMASTAVGHPGRPRTGARPPAWAGLARAAFHLTFEDDGLRVQAELERE